LTQTSNVGGESVTLQTADAVKPARPADPSVVMMFTAAPTAGVYLSRGYIDASLDFPVILGALTGSTLGARLLPRIRVSTLRRCFACIAGAVGVEMIVKGIAAWNV